ncbi:MAG: Rrf2 family transcriptional regulator [Planctomycetota bacterium]
MRWNKSTRFALYAAMEMVRAGDGLVSAVGIAGKYRISLHHMAKVLQQMARAGIVQAVRGVGGGYRLAKPPKDTSLLDIVEVFEGPIDIQTCLLTDTADPCGMADLCRLKRVFDEIEQQAFFTLKSIRLSTLVP